MLVREAKLLNGTQEQYQALDEAIRTAQFIRNKCVRHWMDNQGVGKPALYVHSKDLAKEFEFAKKLNSTARQASSVKFILKFNANVKTGRLSKLGAWWHLMMSWCTKT
jgi:putative transposase